ncbi:MerR family transcriptional regulator [Luteococcus peritonei]
MRIGELARRTEVAPRMLRYYEEQGLISPERLPNGYRDYGDYLVERVMKIRGLLEAGIPTRIIADMLPCLDQSQEIVVADADPRLREVLVREREAIAQRIHVLQQNHKALTRYVEAMDRAPSPDLARSA